MLRTKKILNYNFHPDIEKVTKSTFIAEYNLVKHKINFADYSGEDFFERSIERFKSNIQVFLGNTDQYVIPVLELKLGKDENNTKRLKKLIEACHKKLPLREVSIGKTDTAFFSEVIIIGANEKMVNEIHHDHDLNKTSPQITTKDTLIVFYVKDELLQFYKPLLYIPHKQNRIEVRYPNTLDVEVTNASTDICELLEASIIFENKNNSLKETLSDPVNSISSLTEQDAVRICYKLLELDTIIGIENTTLFQFFCSACLEKPIMQIDSPKFGQDEIPGFKIEDLHIKLSNNCHFQHFIYDSKMLQNSFFADSFAIELANLILEKWKLYESANKIEHYQIIGYAQYSELLVAEVARLLNENFEKMAKNRQTDVQGKFDYDIIDATANTSDTQSPPELRLCINKNNLRSENSKIILVVPVGGVTDRTMKLAYESLIKYYGIKSENITLLVNIVRISPSMTKSNERKDNDAQSFYQEIQIPFTGSGPQRVFYFVESYRDYQVEDDNTQICKFCFPESATDERPLIEIRKKYKTPIIFNNELAYTGAALEKYPTAPITYDKSFYDYGYQVVSEKKEHLHYIKSHVFFQEQKVDIRKWLLLVRQNIKNSINPRKKIVLVALEGNFNYEFASLINEIVFDKRASLIHHNTKNDFIENSKGFYGDIVADSELYYVDDLMLTGNTFLSFNNFIRQLWYDWNIEQKPFRGVFALFVRADDFAINQVARELSKNGKIHTYTQLRVPPLYTFNNPSPIKQRAEWYSELARYSKLDGMKRLFLERSAQVTQRKERGTLMDYEQQLNDIKSPSDLFNITDRIAEIENRAANKHIPKLLTTHLVFSLTSKDYERFFDRNATFDSLVNSIFENVYFKNHKANKHKYYYSKSEWEVLILKTLSDPPFTYYSNIQSSVLRWLIERTDKLLNHLLYTENRSPYQWHENYRLLRLYFRKLANLRAFYIIREETLNKVIELYKRHRDIDWNIYWTGRQKSLSYLQSLLEQNPLPADILIKAVGSNFYEKYCRVFENERQSEIVTPTENIVCTIKYYCQLVLNFDDYYHITNTSALFMAACIKEVAYGNQQKTSYIENYLNRKFAELGENIYHKEHVMAAKLLFYVGLDSISNQPEIGKSTFSTVEPKSEEDPSIYITEKLGEIKSTFNKYCKVEQINLTVFNEEDILDFSDDNKRATTNRLKTKQAKEFQSKLKSGLIKDKGVSQTVVIFRRDIDNEYRSLWELKEIMLPYEYVDGHNRLDRVYFVRISDVITNSKGVISEKCVALLSIGLSIDDPRLFPEVESSYLQRLLIIKTTLYDVLAVKFDFQIAKDFLYQAQIWNLYKHGTDRYFSNLENYIFDCKIDNSIKEDLKLQLLLINQSSIIKNIIEEYQSGQESDSVLASYFTPSMIYKKDLINTIDHIGRFILKDTFYHRVSDSLLSELSRSNDFYFSMHGDLLKIILAEIFTNIYNEFTKLPGNYWIGIEICTYDSIVFLRIKNSMAMDLQVSTRRTENITSRKTSDRGNGLNMIRYIYLNAYSRDILPRTISDTMGEFHTLIPLLNFQKI